MGERSKDEFFVTKAAQAEARAAQASDDKERAIWLEVAQEYRRLAIRANKTKIPDAESSLD